MVSQIFGCSKCIASIMSVMRSIDRTKKFEKRRCYVLSRLYCTLYCLLLYRTRLQHTTKIRKYQTTDAGGGVGTDTSVLDYLLLVGGILNFEVPPYPCPYPTLYHLPPTAYRLPPKSYIVHRTVLRSQNKISCFLV